MLHILMNLRGEVSIAEVGLMMERREILKTLETLD